MAETNIADANVERMVRDLAYYRLLPEDYPKGGPFEDNHDIALRRVKSWASMWADTHAGLDQQIRVCASYVVEEVERLRIVNNELLEALQATVESGEAEGGSGWFVARHAREILGEHADA